jgi:hypothetical protein
MRQSFPVTGGMPGKRTAGSRHFRSRGHGSAGARLVSYPMTLRTRMLSLVSCPRPSRGQPCGSPVLQRFLRLILIGLSSLGSKWDRCYVRPFWSFREMSVLLCGNVGKISPGHSEEQTERRRADLVRRGTQLPDLVVSRRLSGSPPISRTGRCRTDNRRPYATYRDAFDAARALFFFSITWGFE